MRSYVFILLFTACFYSGLSANEKSTSKPNVHSCTELLPADQAYKLVLTTNIDTSKEVQGLSWSIKMTDGEGEEDSDAIDNKKDKEIEPFIECLLPLIQ